jgi:hypothetical protein
VVDVLYAKADDGTHIAYRVLDADPSAEPVVCPSPSAV